MRRLLGPVILWLVLALILLGARSIHHTAHAEDVYQMDENVIYHFHRGQMWMEVGQYDAAIREFQIGIRLSPTTAMTADLYNNMGLAYIKAREFPKAIVSFQQAIALSPNFSLYYENLAKAYQKSGAMETAQEQLRQTTSVNTEDAQAWYLLGVLYKEAGNESSCREALEQFVKLSPHSELADAAKLYLQSP